MFRTIVWFISPVVAVLDRVYPFKRKRQETRLPLKEISSPKSSTKDEVEQALLALSAGKEAWAALSSKQKGQVLRDCLQCMKEHTKAAAVNAADHKGAYDAGVGEEMLIVGVGGIYIDEFEKLQRAGKPEKPLKKHKQGDRWICDVWPRGMDNMLYSGAVGEIWIKPGQEATQGLPALSKEGAQPGIACVLAAGNHLPTVIRDILQQLVVNGNVCIVKINPVNAFIGTDVEMLLRPLVDIGALRLVYGTADVAQMAMHDPRVRGVHMTGSTATYNRICWGACAPGQGPKLLDKPFEAELGCITPYIIVPSKKRWCKAELEYHAMTAIASKVMNSGHNCNAVEVVVTAEGWPQREEFLDALRKVLNGLNQRWPWYPGTQDRMQAFQQKFPAAEELGIPCKSDTHSTQPFLLAAGVHPAAVAGDTEKWGPALQEVPLPCSLLEDGSVNVPEFLKAAAEFCNYQLFGTLSCGVSVHPSVARHHRDAFEDFVGDLKYGSVSINTPPTMGVAFATLPWGAWAAAGTVEDIGTGNVLSHTGLYEHAEKGVVRAPWRSVPHPISFPDHTNLEAVINWQLRYMASRGPHTLTPLVAAALGSR